MAIVKPENMDFSNKNIIMIISGLPGVGKTTLALSAPDVLLVDADEGMARVNPAHRKDSSICKTYEELLTDIKAAEGHYKTIVIDTGGALIELMKDWAMRTEPTANKKNGGFSLQGYGVIKSEFLRMSADLRRKFNVIFLFHTTREKNGDEDFFEIVVEGSTRSLVYQPADLAAYCHIINGERYLGFTPTMNYNAKSAYGIKGLIKVPELKDGDKNDFLTRLFAQVKANISAESATLKPQQAAYEKAMEEGANLILKIASPEQALPTLNDVRNLKHSLTSKKELEAFFKETIKALGYTYNEKAGVYVAKAEK
jgi:transcriptional regulator CtsR